MKQINRTVTLETKSESFTRIGNLLNKVLLDMTAQAGLLHIFVCHTSASLCVQENTDPDVLLDLRDTLRRLAPPRPDYRHNSEGSDDMPAHIKTLLTAVSLALPVRQGQLALGTWQEVYLIEHRAQAHRRRLELDFIGATL